MGVEEESLARLWSGSLSLKEFEWQEKLRPDVPFDCFHEAGVIPEIDLAPLLQDDYHCSGERGRASDDDDGIRDHGEKSQLESTDELLDQIKVQPDGIYNNKEEMVLMMRQRSAGRRNIKEAQQDDHRQQLEAVLHDHQYDEEQPDLYYDKEEVQVQAVKESVCAAARCCGFFQVYNHGVPVGALCTLLDCSRRFFSLPFPAKARLARSLISFLGSRPTYTAGNPGDYPNRWWCEALRLDSQSPSTIDAIAQCLWPDNPHDRQNFCDALSICSHGLTKLAENLTRVLLEGLGINYIEEILKMCGDNKSLVKLGHYPSCPQSELTLGLPAHTDVTILSILFQDDVGGLQVQQDGSWASIRPRDDALVVNIGDIFQVWSNDKYVSGLHRVVLNPLKSRNSVNYFYTSSGESMVSNLLKEEDSKFHSTSTNGLRQHTFNITFRGGHGGVDHLRIS